ncbi:MAG: hypothetical protein EA397_02005 [Deltaproteobacteria bacterium]|nr:MAG: hypothetical protein EA397_02005 [Deltaproteobacteria bacterium]
MRLASTATCLLLVMSACRRLDDIPEDADGAAAWLYQHQPDGEAGAVEEALLNLRQGLGLDDLDEPLEGLLLPLNAEAVAAVGRTALETLPEEERDAIDEALIEDGTYVVLADQQGMLIASVIPCTVEDTVAVHVRLDQDEIHGGYDFYERTYLQDAAPFLNGQRDDLAWSTDYTVSVVGSTYDATIHGQIRWVDLPDGTKLGLGRAHLAEPGVFTRGGGYFRQDYHLDLFYEIAPGQTVHVFSVWRDLRVSGVHSSNAAFIATTSRRFVESDREKAEICADDSD